ncbi:SRPBCC family protein [Streptomyces sp. NBC_00234]|uniref:SRPBCC family protein n=1 Tax=Streptomyces sp. NBC_00234 TaxID=2903638 RepID=UPI002E2CE928|nr:SRPBCC family protein [Streptomyces sp. NBC_00234]
MIRVQRTMLVRRPLDEAITFLEDFARTEQWDPATVSCLRLDSGPVRPGSSWRNTSRFRGRTTELTYRLSVRDADRLVFVGENRTVVARDDLHFVHGADGTTRLSYRATFRFKGVARLVAFLLRKDVERLADDVAAALPRVLDAEVS